MSSFSIKPLSPGALEAQIDALSRILIDTVADGAAISFLDPVQPEQARAFWQADVLPEAAAGHRTVFAAYRDGTALGTVQLITALPQNQPHRAEIAKMMVHPSARRHGVGRSLLAAALDHARKICKTLVTLDTRTGDAAQALYAAAGFEVAGEIPDFALDPDAHALHPTTYMFKRLSPLRAC